MMSAHGVTPVCLDNLRTGGSVFLIRSATLRLTFLVGNSVAANALVRTAVDCCSHRFSLGSPVQDGT